MFFPGCSSHFLFLLAAVLQTLYQITLNVDRSSTSIPRNSIPLYSDGMYTGQRNMKKVIPRRKVQLTIHQSRALLLLRDEMLGNKPLDMHQLFVMGVVCYFCFFPDGPRRLMMNGFTLYLNYQTLYIKQLTLFTFHAMRIPHFIVNS